MAVDRTATEVPRARPSKNATLPRKARRSWRKARPSSVATPLLVPARRRLRNLEPDEAQLAPALHVQHDGLADGELGQQSAQGFHVGHRLLVERVDDVPGAQRVLH